MMKLLLSIFFLVISIEAFSQAQTESFLDMDAAIGSAEGTFSMAYIHNWKVGKRKKLLLGVGGRFSTYFGQNQFYVTAPASITSGSTGPGVFFKENIEENMDSLLINSAQVNAVNAKFNIGYQFSDKISLGFNIDLLGFSFGGERDGNYINGNQGQMVSSSPTPFNVLLISDNDIGSLNSELYIRYAVSEKWQIRGGAQFLFTEYTTDTEVQQFPEPNDRFRNKSLMLMLGAGFRIK
ncbi:MAG: hypothetical protein HC811_08445 [Flammeovirgaceae bacterium]|nr:hypothetical protein [Flammeovirgaceae bacterium]